ncbi:preprotein translocase subunit YajC [Fictibacillus macauensis ZFHKF-1]|uniref:Preprotein translocase subunit YajC n=1 Tax=Fictibacillus macauensis ZFHKF-1 TaxID=1196324 RepID=I8J0N1_9BACL|nr:preprotein translocase subunit YajC [Fictibacillus macauensis]EIT85316.1 preprotein translocase subunit YajC [Fictibacillus macauensis ZFHKF-1]
MGSIIMIVAMFVVFYFLLIRPQQKRQKAVQTMQGGLKKGDQIVTIGGLHGTIDMIDENTAVIRSKDGAKLTFERNAIREVRQSAPAPTTEV